MKIAMIGLGKMGLNMATRLSRSGISVVGYDIANVPNEYLPAKNFCLKKSLSDVVDYLPSPRIVWLMLPSGIETENVVESLTAILSAGDVIIDGANSNYKDTLKRGSFITSKGHHFIDVGVSGGIWGLKDGYCLMVGGETKVIEKLAPIFNALSANGSNGWQHLGPLGTGHFAKMIHNGIEYGMMQAISEGLELCHSKKQLPVDTKKLIELWRHGSVVRSWLLDTLSIAMQPDTNLDDVLPFVPDSGEGRWFAIEAIEQGISTPVITQALNVRLQSQNNFSYGLRILSIMRNAFGGHKIHKK